MQRTATSRSTITRALARHTHTRARTHKHRRFLLGSTSNIETLTPSPIAHNPSTRLYIQHEYTILATALFVAALTIFGKGKFGSTLSLYVMRVRGLSPSVPYATKSYLDSLLA